MARRKGNFLTGIIGPVVLKVVNDKQIVASRVAKGKIKHSEATKKSNHTFGMASTLASQFRRTIAEQFVGMYDFDMASRLSGAFFSILSKTRNKDTREYHFEQHSFESLTNFNFHQSYKVSNRLAKMPEVYWKNNVLEVGFTHIEQPGSLQFVNGSYKCTVTITLSLFRLKEGYMVAQAKTEEFVVLKQVGLQQSLHYRFEVPQGCFYILCIGLQYVATGKNGYKLANSPKLTAASICRAEIVGGDYENNDHFHWEEMERY